MKIIIVTGPSATGKTSLALQYAKECDGELVNFDSRQIYKKLDIITGKDKEIIKNFKFPYVPQGKQTSNLIWLYDLVDPKEYFSSFDFTQTAMKVLMHILKRKKTPILVGGTYLYLYHLLYQVQTENIPPNIKLREKLNEFPVKNLQQKLVEIDKPLFASLNESDKKNPQRLIRKIEIASFYKKKGIKVPTKMKFIFNDFFKDKNIEFIGLTFHDREKLLSTIKLRVDKRLQEGAIDEVKKLLTQGYTENDPGMKTIGYQQVMRYLKGKITKQLAIDEWILREFQYTKRQLTFMKKDPNIIWKYI
ncbi:tRNA (adenosine(37)-N6)-dimethylallyltransferase MiaA [Candidatus Roizmanbacteria bacterium]|nr:tRNA (adenosine(37)-N6)-dimethylallyltransferase MiaA [Candidatus Roizmanbacteria bacterium]